MGSLGWFILGYMLTGVIVNYASTYVMIGIVAIKTLRDRQKKLKDGEIKDDAPLDDKYTNAFKETFETASDMAEAKFAPGNRKLAMIKAWVIGTLILWPITVFTGIRIMWNQIKDVDDNQ